MSDNTLGERIRASRQGAGITQDGLAASLGVTPQHISAIEQDKRIPSLPLLARLAKGFGVTTDYLITGQTEWLPDTVSVIMGDMTLSTEVKKALAVLVLALRARSGKGEAGA